VVRLLHLHVRASNGLQRSVEGLSVLIDWPWRRKGLPIASFLLFLLLCTRELQHQQDIRSRPPRPDENVHWVVGHQLYTCTEDAQRAGAGAHTWYLVLVLVFWYSHSA
jgi:hypothetical protein